MARPQKIDDEALMMKLSDVFRDVGFAGASLAKLSEATGLKRASLYHRFPDGKEQMAREVLDRAGAVVEAGILQPLQSEEAPRDRITTVVTNLEAFYVGGKKACLLNMLASPGCQDELFNAPIQAIFTALIGGFVSLLQDAGFDDETALTRAERAIALLQGSLVLSRGLGTTRPFQTFLDTLPEELFGA